MPDDIAFKPNEKLSAKQQAEYIPSPKKFTPTFFDWLVSKGELIIKHAVATNTTTTLYTIPTTKFFYLVSAELSCNANALATGGWADMLIKDLVAGRLFCTDAIDTSEGVSMDYSIPLKLIAGETIKVRSDAANAFASLSIMGYLIDYKDTLLF